MTNIFSLSTVFFHRSKIN